VKNQSFTKEERWLLTEKYRGEKSAGFFADCERLQAGEPLGYIIGHVPFLGGTIWLDSHPLIPRPETEYWVEHAIRIITETDEPRIKVLDLCAGSGAIGVAVATHVPGARVDFGEIDARHEPTILKNLAANDITLDRARVTVSDLFTHIPDRYDFILSNPPYIDPALDRTEASVKGFEPHLALYGGRGGLALIEQIIAASPAHLTSSGQLWLEHEPEQAATINKLGSTHGFATTTHPDQYDTLRYSVLVLQ